MGETPGIGPGVGILSRTGAPAGPAGVNGPGGVVQAGVGPAARPADALPTGPAAAPVVQICHKGPDRAGTPEENR